MLCSLFARGRVPGLPAAWGTPGPLLGTWAPSGAGVATNRWKFGLFFQHLSSKFFYVSFNGYINTKVEIVSEPQFIVKGEVVL